MLTSRMHGVLDYVLGAIMILSPWLFGFRQDVAGTVVVIVLGLVVICYSLLTTYEYGVLRRISMQAHLGIDFGLGVLLAISPWLFGFANHVYAPHLVLGLIAICVAGATIRIESSGPHRWNLSPRL